MTTYKEIYGTNIEVVSSDPSNPVEGQIWYNTTSNVVKGISNNPGSWSTGADLNTARGVAGGAGVSNASALAFGGFPVTGATEAYNGTAWTELNDLNSGRRQLAGAGTQTAALGFGGDPNVALTELWNGTNWTEVNDLNQGRQKLSGAGATNTAALAFGGQPGPDSATELWNGTNWTAVNSLNSGRYYIAGAGTQTSAIAAGGEDKQVNTESWNGTNWTEVNNLNNGRHAAGSAGSDNTSALVFGGLGAGPSNVAFTESWNGSNWTELADMSVARQMITGAGVQTSALGFGGYATPYVATTEEWNAGLETVTFDVS